MTSFWDDPANRPPTGGWPDTPGDTVEGVVTRMKVAPSRYGRLSLCIELDGDGRERWCNGRLWRTLAEARVEPGDRVRVTRGQNDTDARPGASGKPPSTWIVERLPMRPTPGATGPRQDGLWASADTPAPPQRVATNGPVW